MSLGRLVEGTEILRKTLREPLPAEPTPALTKALERAQRALDSAKPRIAGLTIKVAAVDELSLKVDGAIVPGALVDTEIPSDPGEHSIEVSAPGFLKAATHIRVGEGEKKTVALTLTRDPDAAVAAPVTAGPVAGGAAASQQSPTRSPKPAPATPPGKTDRTAGFLTLGLGVATVGAGAFMGSLAMSQHEELQRSCPNNVCPPEQSDALDSAKRLGTFSTIAFGVGGAAMVLGTVLLVTASPSHAESAAVGPKPRRFAGLSRPRAAIGPTSIELGADF